MLLSTVNLDQLFFAAANHLCRCSLYFLVEVQGANMAAMHQNIKRVVDEEQEKHVWL